MYRNLVFTAAYKGTRYSGWQSQPEERIITVQDEIEKVMSILCDCPVKIEGCSRTDGGVHARGQVFRLRGDFAIPTENILRAANNLLPVDIALTEVFEADEEFHPRYDCKKKTYTYRILNSKIKDPFRENFTYHVDRPLNVEAMKIGAAQMVGRHDFVGFQATGGTLRKTTVRRIFDINIFTRDEEVIIEVTGDGFLYNMVRIIAGTLVDVGLGKIKEDSIGKIIEQKDRKLAGHTAPPQGLCLDKIYFEEDEHA